MKRTVLGTALLLIVATGELHGQVDEVQDPVENGNNWSQSYRAGINFNQASFSGNWRGGGVNSLSLGTLGVARINYGRDRISFDNELELLYGIVRQEGQEVRKANDQILLDSKIGYALREFWNAYFSLNFESQFARGYEFVDDERRLISDFLSPAFITSSLGFEYMPGEEFVLRIGPMSPRLTIVRNQTIYQNVPENYGVTPGETYRLEPLALQLYARLDTDIAEDLNFRARYRLFASYESFTPADTEHRFDVTLTATVVRFVDVTMSGIMLYDNDQDPGVQYSTGLTVGIVFRITP